MDSETLRTVMLWVQIVVAVALVALILAQVRGQGGGLFGSAESSYRTRRGVERAMFQFTIVLIVAFLTTAVINVRLY